MADALTSVRTVVYQPRVLAPAILMTTRRLTIASRVTVALDFRAGPRPGVGTMGCPQTCRVGRADQVPKRGGYFNLHESVCC
jgi:hypothetical protein